MHASFWKSTRRKLNIKHRLENHRPVRFMTKRSNLAWLRIRSKRPSCSFIFTPSDCCPARILSVALYLVICLTNLIILDEFKFKKNRLKWSLKKFYIKFSFFFRLDNLEISRFMISDFIKYSWNGQLWDDLIMSKLTTTNKCFENIEAISLNH